MERVHSSVGSEIAAISDVTKCWIHQRFTSCSSVLHGLITSDIRQKGLVGKKRLEFLGELLGSEKRRLNQELRDVRSHIVAVAHKHVPAKEILRCDRTLPLVGSATLNKRSGIQIRDGSSHCRVTVVICECHVAKECRPIVLNLFGCSLRSGNTRREWNAEGM